MVRVGEKIKRLREDREWTQPHLAVKAGVAVSAVSQIENGRRSPNVSTLDKLADALGVEVGDLFRESEVPKAPGLALQLELDGQGGADEEQVRHYLSAILDPWIRQLRHLSDTFGPRLRLGFPDDPLRGRRNPDAPPPVKTKSILSWIAWFTDTCILIERILDDRSLSRVVDPWLSRMNDETVSADIRQKLHDFQAARTEVFEELEPLAEEWREALKERLSDEELVELNADLGYSPEEHKDAATSDV